MQINYLETPMNTIYVSSGFEAKTATCLSW